MTTWPKYGFDILNFDLCFRFDHNCEIFNTARVMKEEAEEKETEEVEKGGNTSQKK